jgi:hypothetical protein
VSDEEKYSELAQITKNLASYRTYRAHAITRRDDAIAEEEQNIQDETKRIEATETRIREIVKELGLT